MKATNLIVALLGVQIILTSVLVVQMRGLSVAPAAQAGAQGQAAAAGAQGGGTGQQGSGSALAPTIDTTEDPVEGDPNAPVTIIEFSDFQCPYCETFFSQSLPQIRSQYIDTGKVKMIYKQFPLSFHPKAQKAAEASECAFAQGKFWEMHDTIFNNQASMSVANYKKWAGEMGMDQAAFDQCLDSGSMAASVAADQAAGMQAGVSGTPSFLINGQLVVGAQPFPVFQQAIEAALAG